MANHALVVGWNRPIPGREVLAVEIFQSFMAYLAKQQQAKVIESFEPVFLASHGGDLNGFTIVRGERERLSQMTGTDEWYELVTKCQINVEGFGVIQGLIGEQVASQMARYQRNISK